MKCSAASFFGIVQTTDVLHITLLHVSQTFNVSIQFLIHLCHIFQPYLTRWQHIPYLKEPGGKMYRIRIVANYRLEPISVLLI